MSEVVTTREGLIWEIMKRVMSSEKETPHDRDYLLRLATDVAKAVEGTWNGTMKISPEALRQSGAPPRR
jgi:hypothetical protein